MTYELTFDNAADAEVYFLALSFSRLPLPRETRAAHGFSDSGHAIVTFARRLYGAPIRYSFTEQTKRI